VGIGQVVKNKDEFDAAFHRAFPEAMPRVQEDLFD
jgi:hypothetical protein